MAFAIDPEQNERLVRLDQACGQVEAGYSHTRDVLKFEHVQPRHCDVQVTDWPYDCISKRKHADHVVFTCVAHSTWWHRSPAELEAMA